jgi:hypothetical protein
MGRRGRLGGCRLQKRAEIDGFEDRLRCLPGVTALSDLLIDCIPLDQSNFI